MQLPVKVRVSRKKIAFFFFHRLVPTPETWEDGKGLSDKTDMPNFLVSDLDLYPPPISL